MGIGAMGGPMITRLAAAGFGVRAHDIDPGRLAAAASLEGVEIAPALHDLGNLEMAICMLPDSAAVRSVVTGPAGLFSVLRPGSLILDMGSSDPRVTAQLAQEAAAAGLGFVDAPVSGGVAKARAGELTVMFGGSHAELERCRELLEVLGQRVVHVGPVGSGHAVKALNNLLSAVGLAAATEVVEIGRRFGLEPETILDAVNHSTGRNHATETKVAQFVLSGTFASGFALRLMLKDIRTAVELGRSLEVDSPLAEACLELWGAAADRLPADADQTRIAMMPAGLSRAESAEVR